MAHNFFYLSLVSSSVLVSGQNHYILMQSFSQIVHMCENLLCVSIVCVCLSCRILRRQCWERLLPLCILTEIQSTLYQCVARFLFAACIIEYRMKFFLLNFTELWATIYVLIRFIRHCVKYEGSEALRIRLKIEKEYITRMRETKCFKNHLGTVMSAVQRNQSIFAYWWR